MYEHKIYPQGIIWNINRSTNGASNSASNSPSHPARTRKSGTVTTHDSSTNGLINRFKDYRVQHGIGKQ